MTAQGRLSGGVPGLVEAPHPLAREELVPHPLTGDH